MDTPRRRGLRPAPSAPARSQGDPSPAEELATLLGRTRRVLRAEVERRLSARGESVLAWQALKHLVRTGPATQVELAQAIGQDPASISRVLEELEREGAVRRARDPADRRRRVAEISARGLRRFQAITPAVVEGVEERLAPLSGAERIELRKLLRKIVGE